MKDYTHPNSSSTVKHRSARHHWAPNLAQYHYVEKRVGKNARAQVFWATTGLIVLLIGSVVAVRMGETAVRGKKLGFKTSKHTLFASPVSWGGLCRRERRCEKSDLHVLPRRLHESMKPNDSKIVRRRFPRATHSEMGVFPEPGLAGVSLPLQPR